MKIGSFISFKSPDYLIESVKQTLNNNANTMMIYLGPPQSSFRTNPKYWKIQEYLQEHSHLIKPEDIIVHAPYIVNLANFEKASFAIDFLIKEIEYMNLIGSKYLVLHPGSYLKQNIDETIIFLSKNLKEIINKTKNVIIVLETMAGKGTEIGTSFEQLKKIIDYVDSERIGICLDTCHLWDGGMDIKTDFENNNGKNLFNILNKLNLLNRIKVIHLNDSKNECGSHKDRHENINQGKIGLKALKTLANHQQFENIPILLETPFIDDDIYKNEIAIIKQK